jgi:salicylate hydroxylase
MRAASRYSQYPTEVRRPFQVNTRAVLTITMTCTGGVLTLHRGDVHKVLLNNMPQSARMNLNKRLITYSQPEDPAAPISLHFADGTEASCDVLIGADGVKSVVRATMLEYLAQAAEKEGNIAETSNLRAAIPPVYSGWSSYRTIVPAEKLRSIAPDHPGLSEAHLVGNTPFV